jgi:hypothetical protein
MPRSARSNSTSRRLRLNTWYSHTSWLMISAGQRWRWCGSPGGVIPQSHSSPPLPPTQVTATMPFTGLGSAVLELMRLGGYRELFLIRNQCAIA